jgi:hypothetical protein
MSCVSGTNLDINMCCDVVFSNAAPRIKSENCVNVDAVYAVQF